MTNPLHISATLNSDIYVASGGQYSATALFALLLLTRRRTVVLIVNAIEATSFCSATTTLTVIALIAILIPMLSDKSEFCALTFKCMRTLAMVNSDILLQALPENYFLIFFRRSLCYFRDKHDVHPSHHLSCCHHFLD